MEAARIAGCVFAVLRNCSSGPSNISLSRPPPRAASASSSAPRAAGKASASACPMPTYCEPCPGNTNASFIDSLSRNSLRLEVPPLPAHEAASPGHSASDGHHQDQVAVLQLAGPVGLVERERDRGGRGVPHLVDVDFALLQRDLQPPRAPGPPSCTPHGRSSG